LDGNGTSGGSVYLPGRVLGGAQKRRANLWPAWEMDRGIGVGGSVFYQSAFKEFTISDFVLPAFTTFEAMASYRISSETDCEGKR
jgi:hypothetical protein